MDRRLTNIYLHHNFAQKMLKITHRFGRRDSNIMIVRLDALPPTRYRFVARKMRLEYSGAIYHLLNRGDHREAIFDDDTDLPS
jgi:hypothetical protein